ncbi:MAG: EF-hand domain-containing protein [Candidatus Gastranaerophilales bacterium]|nr:EF-hand domain-containing protein [Candidatus Gastranaerophilales bacterium]
MYDKSQATGIFTAAQSGLQSSLQYLFTTNKDGVDRTTLNNAIYNNTTGTNTSFFQMINNQFATLDKNNDGVLSADEANQMVTDVSSGLTRDQVLQMRASGAIDEELANKIVANFSKMDTNGDGRVSEAEINAYCLDEDVKGKQDEQTKLTIKNMSLYYDVDTDDDVKES